MDGDKIYEMFLNVMQKLAVVEAKLDTLDEIKIDAKSANSRIDHLEAQNSRHEKQISSLEHRNNTLEEFVRNEMTDSKKQKNTIMVSVGIAVFSAVLSFVFNLL